MAATLEKGWEYIRSLPFVLKAFEFLVLFIAIITVGIFLDKANHSTRLYDPFEFYGKKGALEFAMFVVVVAWLLVIGFAVFFICGAHEKIPVVNWALAMVIQQTFWFILLFISACLVADAARHYENYDGPLRPFCHYLDIAEAETTCVHLVAGAVCIFVATLLFFIDILVHYKIHRDITTLSDQPITAATIT